VKFFRQQVASSLFFKYNTALGPPYHILLDTNFINFSIQNKLDIMQSMMDCLYAKCMNPPCWSHSPPPWPSCLNLSHPCRYSVYLWLCYGWVGEAWSQISSCPEVLSSNYVPGSSWIFQHLSRFLLGLPRIPALRDCPALTLEHMLMTAWWTGLPRWVFHVAVFFFACTDEHDHFTAQVLHCRHMRQGPQKAHSEDPRCAHHVHLLPAIQHRETSRGLRRFTPPFSNVIILETHLILPPSSF